VCSAPFVYKSSRVCLVSILSVVSSPPVSYAANRPRVLAMDGPVVLSDSYHSFFPGYPAVRHHHTPPPPPSTMPEDGLLFWRRRRTSSSHFTKVCGRRNGHPVPRRSLMVLDLPPLKQHPTESNSCSYICSSSAVVVASKPRPHPNQFSRPSESKLIRHQYPAPV